MTPGQFQEWRRQSLWVARWMFGRNRRPYVFWITDRLNEFFDTLDPRYLPCIDGHFESLDMDGCGCWSLPATSPRELAEHMLSMHRGRGPQCRRCPFVIDDDNITCRCAEIEEHYQPQWDRQWGGPVLQCLKLGLMAAFVEMCVSCEVRA